MKKQTIKKTNEGVALYNQIGLILIFCGLLSFLILTFVSFLPQDYEKYNIPLFFGIWASISLISIILGILPLLLGKYCTAYQKWIDKEVKSFRNKY